MNACRLSPQEAWDFPLLQGHAYVAYAEQNNGVVAVDMVTPGYIQQEAERILRGQ